MGLIYSQGLRTREIVHILNFISRVALNDNFYYKDCLQLTRTSMD